MLLFVDVETTGLNKKEDRIVQIAWIATNREGGILNKDDYIIRPDDFYIPYSASSIHGITNDRAKAEGVALSLALQKFKDDAEKAEFLIGHNISFDFSFISSDLKRAKIEHNLVKMPQICTMKSSTNYCRIPKFNGRQGFKWPNLSELHLHLFNEGFDGAHDAASDIHATMRCFFKLLEIREIILPPPLERAETRRAEAQASPIFEKPKSSRADATQRGSQAATKLLACPKCKTANRIPADRSSDGAKCGKCSAILAPQKRPLETFKTPSPETSQRPGAALSRLLDCPHCGVANRIPVNATRSSGRCGKCGIELDPKKEISIDSIKISNTNVYDKDIEILLERLISYGLKPEKSGSSWSIQGMTYKPHELYDFERHYVQYLEKINSGYTFISNENDVKEEAVENPIFKKSDNEIIEYFRMYGFEIEKYGSSSNWKFDGGIYFPHDLSQLVSKCTPQRLIAVTRAPYIAKLLSRNGFIVQKSGSNWLVDGSLLSPERMVQLEAQCTPERLAAVKRAPSIAATLRKHGLSVEPKMSNWLVNGLLLTPEEVVKLNPDDVAMRLRDRGYSVLKVGRDWKVDGEVLSTKQLIDFEKNQS